MLILRNFTTTHVQKLMAILSWAGNTTIDKNEEVGDTVDRIYKTLVEEGQLMGDYLE